MKRFLNNLVKKVTKRITGPQTARRLRATTLGVEGLEQRELLASDWFSTYIANPNVASLLRGDWGNHGSVTRNDMLAVFSQVERDGRVDSSELDSLKFLANHGNLLKMPASVQALTGEVVSTTEPANQYYQGGGLGSLSANSPASKLKNLVNKWFLGMDHPGLAAGTSGTYRAVSGSLFGTGGPQYTDVYQGSLGDCTYLSSLAETAARTNGIASMFTADGDNTWTVRLYHNGTPTYVTVDNLLPNAGGLYDHPNGGIFWASLAEKAVAQINEEGWLGSVQPGVNSYNAINNGNSNTVVAALGLFSGRSASSVSIGTSASNLAQDMAAGKLVVIATGNTPGLATIEGNHAYAVVGYNPSAAQPFTVFNPWGIKNLYVGSQVIWGQFTATGAALKAYFIYAGQTSAAPDRPSIAPAIDGFMGGADRILPSSPVASAEMSAMPTLSLSSTQADQRAALALSSERGLSDLVRNIVQRQSHRDAAIELLDVAFASSLEA